MEFVKGNEDTYIDDLTTEQTQIAVGRELLRFFASCTFRGQQGVIVRRESAILDQIKLAVLRSLITIFSSASQDAAFSALKNFQSARLRYSEWVDQRGQNLDGLLSRLAILESLLLSGCAEAYSPSRDALEYLEEAVERMYEVGVEFPADNLHFGTQALILMLNRADASLRTPLWFVDEFEGQEGAAHQDTIKFAAESWGFSQSEFWLRWYRATCKGKPLPHYLLLQVSQIADGIWQSGPEAVAKEIARIEAEWEAEQVAKQGRVPELEPDNVVQLFQYPQTVMANVSHVSTTITQSFELFRQETGLNETPEMVLPLETMVASLDRIGDLVAKGQSAANEQALQEEIGRLNGRIVQLEAELAKAKTDLELQKKPWFGPGLKYVMGSVVPLTGLALAFANIEATKACENSLTWLRALGAPELYDCKASELPVVETPDLPPITEV